MSKELEVLKKLGFNPLVTPGQELKMRTMNYSPEAHLTEIIERQVEKQVLKREKSNVTDLDQAFEELLSLAKTDRKKQELSSWFYRWSGSL